MIANRLIIVVGIVLFSTCRGTKVTNCANFNKTPQVTIVSNNVECVNQPCKVYTGHDAFITINFTSPFYSDHFKLKIKAVAAGATVDWPSGEDNSCVGLTNTVCPIVEGEPLSYTYKMKVLDMFPKILVSMFITLENVDDGRIMTCFNCNLQVS